VLLVPSKVIDFDDQNNQINGHWMELQAIFEQADQCLIIEDPIRNLLDQIHDGVTKSGVPSYLLSKLPLSVASSQEDPAETLLKRSFAAYRAKSDGDQEWIDSRIAAAIAARSSVALPDDRKWIEQVAGSTGLSVDILQQLVDLADNGGFSGTTMESVGALLDWLAKKPIILMEIVRPESLEGLFGEAYKRLPSDAERVRQALAAISQLLPLWMSGVPLCKLEAEFLARTDNLGRCESARHFVSRIVPDLAFLAGLPARLLTARAKQSAVPVPLRVTVATLGSAVREGCDSPEALATRINCGRSISRVMARVTFDTIKGLAPAGSQMEDFEVTRQRMRGAEAVSKFFGSS
jgi:hypothetical protein